MNHFCANLIQSVQRLFGCAIVLCCVTSQSSAQSESFEKAPPEPENCVSIFDGETLDGWNGDPRLWKVSEGVIHGETTKDNAANGNTFLIWEDGTTTDFYLSLSFRCNAANNSGIQYRSRHITDDTARNDWVVRGYQHEIRNEEDFPNVPSFIYDEGGKRGRICTVGQVATWESDGAKVISDDLIDQEEFRELMNIDDWNDVVIIAKGNQIKHYLNGRLVLDFTDNHPELALTKGVLALQLHAGKPMFAEYRDIRFADLSE